MKPDQERVKTLLKDTIVLLCRNGLCFHDQLKVQGLVGITLDGGEVFLVQIDETWAAESAERGISLTGQNAVCEKDSSNSVDAASFVLDFPPGPAQRRSTRNHQSKHRTFPRRCTNKPEPLQQRKCTDLNSDLDPVVKPEISDDGTMLELDRSSGRNNLMQNAMLSPEPHVRSNSELCQSQGFSYNCSTSPISLPLDSDGNSSKMPKTNENLFDCGGGGAFAMHGLMQSAASSLTEPQFLPDNLLYPDNRQDADLQFPNDLYYGGQVTADNSETSRDVTSADDAAGRSFGDELVEQSRLSLELRPNRNSSLKRKSFSCEYDGCGLTFYHSYTLYRHQRIKHGRRFGAVDQMTFFCSHPGCGRVFYRELALVKHQSHIHGK